MDKILNVKETSDDILHNILKQAIREQGISIGYLLLPGRRSGQPTLEFDQCEFNEELPDEKRKYLTELEKVILVISDSEKALPSVNAYIKGELVGNSNITKETKDEFREFYANPQHVRKNSEKINCNTVNVLIENATSHASIPIFHPAVIRKKGIANISAILSLVSNRPYFFDREKIERLEHLARIASNVYAWTFGKEEQATFLESLFHDIKNRTQSLLENLIHLPNGNPALSENEDYQLALIEVRKLDAITNSQLMIKDEMDRISRIIDIRSTITNPVQLIKTRCNEFNPLNKKLCIELQCNLQYSHSLIGSQIAMDIVITNLLTNAQQYSRKKSSLNLTDNITNQHWELQIENTVSEDFLPEKQGSQPEFGIGLKACQLILDKLGGTFRAALLPDQGIWRVNISWPTRESQSTNEQKKDTNCR